MSAAGHPSPEALEAYLEGSLERREHSRLSQHVSGCGDCGRRLERMEPTRVFARLTTAPGARAGGQELGRELWPAIAAGIAARDGARSGVWQALERVLRPRWLAPLGATAALAGVCGALLLGPAPVEVPASASDTLVADFVYLSNDEAEIAHIQLRDEQYGTVQLTMVVDPSFEGEF